MSIDFSKAPESATHYAISGGGNVVWYRPFNGEVQMQSSDAGLHGWRVSGHRLTDDGINQIPTFEPFVSAEDAPTTVSTHDPVNGPQHYNGTECLEAIKASMSHEAFLGFLKGNVQKYLWRFEKKANPVEDLKKAQWYLARLTKEQEGE